MTLRLLVCAAVLVGLGACDRASPPTETAGVEKQAAEAKASDGKPSNDKAPNGKASNSKAPDGKASGGKASDGNASDGKASDGKPSTGPAQPDPRTAQDFARDWAAVRRAPVEQRGVLGGALAKGYGNRIYSWTGHAMAGLCLHATRTCAIHVFRKDQTPTAAMLGGFFPKVVFTEAAYASLRAGCKGKPSCVVEWRGTLSELVTDPAEPLRMVFTEATVTGTRDAQPDEGWFSPQPAGKAPPKTRPNGEVVPPKPLGIGKPVPLPANVRIKPAVF